MTNFTTAETARKMTKTARLSKANEAQLKFVIDNVERCALEGEDTFVIEDAFNNNEPKIILNARTVESLKSLGYSVEVVFVRVGAFYDSNTKIGW